MDRRAFLSAFTAGTASLMAGCTGGGGTPTQTPSPTQVATATESPTGAQAAYPDYEWGMLEGADPVVTTEVVMRDLRFNPLVAAVEPGTDVTFRNEDATKHTVTIPRLDVDETVEGGGSTTVSFDEKGTFDYVCKFHPPSMLGRVVVTDDLPTETTAEGTPSPTPTPTETPSGTTTTTSGGGYY